MGNLYATVTAVHAVCTKAWDNEAVVGGRRTASIRCRDEINVLVCRVN